VTTWITTIPVPSPPSSQPLAELRALEGDRIDLILRDGTRLNDCLLVSRGRLWAKTIWVVSDEIDHFIHLRDILSVEASAPAAPAGGP
jgi:hypothetical protein